MSSYTISLMVCTTEVGVVVHMYQFLLLDGVTVRVGIYK